MISYILKIGMLIFMLSIVNFLFSQKSDYHYEEDGFMQINLGFGRAMYKNNSKASVFSMELGGAGTRFGGFLELNINDCPTLDGASINYVDLKDCSIYDYKLLLHYYPFKVRKILNPYIEAGLGYSTLTAVGGTSVRYNNQLYDLVDRANIDEYFITQLGTGLTIILFKHLAIKAEYSWSFLRNPDYLNGGQYVIKVGLNNFLSEM